MLGQCPGTVFVLKFGHGVPESLGHMVPAALRIVPAFDGDGIVKPRPKLPVELLPPIGRRQLGLLHGHDGALSSAVGKCHMVGAIQNEEAFSRHSCTKMLTQKGQHLTSGFDLGHQRAAVLGKPGEAFEQMGLVGHRTGGDDHIVHPLVGEHFQNLRAHLIAKAQKGQKGNLLLLQIG